MEKFFSINSVGLITTSQYVKEVNAIKDECSNLHHIIIIDEAFGNELDYNELMKQSSRNLELEQTNSDDMAFFCYTSGTAENPKGTVHLQRWVPGNDPSVLFWQEGKKDDIITHTGNLNWIFPLGNGFLYPWRWGFSTFIYDGKFNPKHWFELMEKYKITNLASVPAAYRLFLTVTDATKKYDLSSLRHCISAGEPLNPLIIKEWKLRFNLDILDGIGMTEIMVYVSNFSGMNIKPGSCGKPQPGKICAIVDSEGNLVPKGKSGILAVKQTDPGLFKEYWKKPIITKKSFKKGWFLTGNILYQDNEDYFWYCDSNDLIANSREDTKIDVPYNDMHHKIRFNDELSNTQSGRINRKLFNEIKIEKKGVMR